MSSNSSQIEVGPNIILITRNDDNLQEVEAEKVETTTEGPRNTARNPNNRNDIDCHWVRFMENISEAYRDQNGPINKKNWGLQTVTGEILIKGFEYGKRMSRLYFFLLMFLLSQITRCTSLTNIELRRDKLKETTTGEV